MTRTRIISLAVIALSTLLVVMVLCGWIFPDRRQQFRIVGTTAGDTVFRLEADRAVMTDCTISDDRFTIEGYMLQPCAARLYAGDELLCETVFLERGTVSIDDEGFAHGTISNDAHTAFRIAADSLLGICPEGRYSEVYKLACDSLMRAHITLNRDNSCGAWLAAEYGPSLDIDGRRALLDELTPSVRQYPMLRPLRRSVERFDASQEGCRTMDLTLPDSSGRAVSIDSLLRAGNYVLLDFWATWSAESRNFGERLERVTAPFDSQGLIVCAISLDNSASRRRDAAADFPSQWLQLNGVENARSLLDDSYAIDTLPMNYLLSPERRIVARAMSAEQLGNRLKEIFAEKSQKK